MNKKNILIITIVVFIILFLVGQRLYKNMKGAAFASKKAPEKLGEILKERKEWIDIYEATGPNELWSLLKKRYRQNYHRHTVAHIFGELLYDMEGYRGVTVCDSAFSYGCYHAFFGKALATEGMDIVFDLDEACVEKFGPQDSGCQHGIGHGVLQYLGYNKLKEALNTCNSLPERGRSCFEGVFMEYNFRTDIEGYGAEEELRKITQGNLYLPCPNVDEEYKDACYYELPRWWERIYKSDFEKLGILCQAIVKDEFREDCFRGIGTNAVLASDHKLDDTVKKCDLMPSQEGLNYCRVEASWAFNSVPDYAHLATQVCDGLDDEMQQLCVGGETK